MLYFFKIQYTDVNFCVSSTPRGALERVAVGFVRFCALHTLSNYIHLHAHADL